MKNFIVIPDSYKGTLSSLEIGATMKECILRVYPAAQVKEIPVADGGEGTVDAFLSFVSGERITVSVQGPFGEYMQATYGRIASKTAIIELAACAGLPLVEGRENPVLATTYGVGELIKHAVLHGCTEIILGLGGSCTNDFGAGMASALGVDFINKQGKVFVPNGGTLSDVQAIDSRKAEKFLEHVHITAMCDINNLLCGEQGAAYVFAPQKGADAAMVKLLDQQLAHIAAVIKQSVGMDIKEVPGSGAAGGAGGGAKALLGASLQSGIDTILDAFQFDALLADTDMIFTGEGRIDRQSLYGKVISGIAQRAKQKNVPVIAVVGDALDPLDEVYEMGITSVMSINRRALDFSVAKTRTRQDLAYTMDNILRVMRCVEKRYL